MSHPMAAQAKASQKRRLGKLDAKAGKSWGSSQMYKKTSLPKKNAGSSTPMTISGGTAAKRPDRRASGGGVGKKHRPHATTNIIISHAGGRGGSGGGGGAGPARPPMPMPVPVNRPVPVPVGGGPAGPGPGPMPMAPRPPMPVGPPPVGAMPPGGPPPMPVRPPGMKAGGSVKKAAKGGSLKMKEESPGKSYRGFPHSPTTDVDDAVSAHKHGGGVGRSMAGVGVEGNAKGLKDGGPAGKRPRPPGFSIGKEGAHSSYGGKHVKKRQMGGGGLGMSPMANPNLRADAGGAGGGGGLIGPGPGRSALPEQQGPANISGRPMLPAQPLTVPMPSSMGSRLTRPAPGTTTTYSKKGGAVGYKKGGHADEAQDKKLFKKMIAKEEKAEKKAKGGVVKRAGGGFVPTNQNSKDPGLAGTIYHNEGIGFRALGGVVEKAGSGSGQGRLAKEKSAEKVPAKTEL